MLSLERWTRMVSTQKSATATEAEKSVARQNFEKWWSGESNGDRQGQNDEK